MLALVKECNNVEELSENTAPIIFNPEIRILIQKFLQQLSCRMTEKDFIAFMNQPSVTLLSGSEQVSALCSAVQAIEIHSEQFQWFKLVQLQNCVEILNNCFELQIILDKIRGYFNSYIEHRRTKILSQKDCFIAFKIDPMYKYFQMIDLRMMEACISAYYHDKYELTPPVDIRYWVCYKGYKSSFSGTHPIQDSLYDSGRSSFVEKTCKLRVGSASVTGVNAQMLDVSSHCKKFKDQESIKPFIS